jgi:hypothetical protein
MDATGSELYETEEQAWSALSPEERFRQFCGLLEFYLACGGSPVPERDSQSPFDFPEYYYSVNGTTPS